MIATVVYMVNSGAVRLCGHLNAVSSSSRAMRSGPAYSDVCGSEVTSSARSGITDRVTPTEDDSLIVSDLHRRGGFNNPIEGLSHFDEEFAERLRDEGFGSAAIAKRLGIGRASGLPHPWPESAARGCGRRRNGLIAMPIRRDLRALYPAHWRELSRRVRFERAGGICQGCGRPHGAELRCLPDGRWFDPMRKTWRDGKGRLARWPDLEQIVRMRTTRVVLAAAHLDHTR